MKFNLANMQDIGKHFPRNCLRQLVQCYLNVLTFDFSSRVITNTIEVEHFYPQRDKIVGGINSWFRAVVLALQKYQSSCDLKMFISTISK